MELFYDFLLQLLENGYIRQELDHFFDSSLVYILDDFLVAFFVHHTKLAVGSTNDSCRSFLCNVEGLFVSGSLQSLFAESFAFVKKSSWRH